MGTDPPAPVTTLARVRAWARRLEVELTAIYLAVRDPRTPWYARLVGAAVVAYAFSPIDLIPDFIPILGYLDDQLRHPKPVSWSGAVFVGLVWATLAVSATWLWIRAS
jgi:uncharacterized membrane protein YkvA (DUF1232 family)